jgi:hypothetical protein
MEELITTVILVFFGFALDFRNTFTHQTQRLLVSVRPVLKRSPIQNMEKQQL